MLSINETNNAAQVFFSNPEEKVDTSLLQNNSNVQNTWKLRERFTMEALNKMRSSPRVVQQVFNYIMLHCDNDEGTLYHSLETIGSHLNYSTRSIKRATKILHDLGIISKKQRGLNKSNLYIANFISSQNPHKHMEGTSHVPLSTTNNKLKEKKYFGSKRKWIEPEPLPPDFDFTAKEKQIIAETYKVESYLVDEAIVDWKLYNETRLGFNWFKSFNGFCARRKWYKQSFKKPNRFMPIASRTENQSPMQAKIASRASSVAEKMKSYKKKYPQKERLPDQIDIIKIESEYNSALLATGMINEKHRKDKIKHIMGQTYYGYK